METKEIIIPDGWEIEKVEDNKVILKESKKELTKTWEECFEQLNHKEFIQSSNSEIIRVVDSYKANNCNRNIIPVGLGKPLLALCQLLVCRDVYRQGWKPDWKKNDEDKYCIKYQEGGCLYEDRFLSFQSTEVRNQFLENFKDLIEEAKELI